jgi:hypothetical protein
MSEKEQPGYKSVESRVTSAIEGIRNSLRDQPNQTVESRVSSAFGAVRNSLALDEVCERRATVETEACDIPLLRERVRVHLSGVSFDASCELVYRGNEVSIEQWNNLKSGGGFTEKRATIPLDALSKNMQPDNFKGTEIKMTKEDANLILPLIEKTVYTQRIRRLSL